MLVLPVAGAPVSFEQVEERSYKREDGSTSVEALEQKVYRDSLGRVRIEARIGHSPTLLMTQIFDPVGSRLTVLIPEPEKVGYWWSMEKSDNAKFANYAFAASGGDANPSPLKLRTEQLGNRVFDGIEFSGTRTIAVREQGKGSQSVEEWYSKELNVIALLIVLGNNETHTARIQNIRREEPSPDLFRIPTDYKISQRVGIP